MLKFRHRVNFVVFTHSPPVMLRFLSPACPGRHAVTNKTKQYTGIWTAEVLQVFKFNGE